MTVAESARARKRLQSLAGQPHALLVGRASAGIVAALQAGGLHDAWVLIPANICYIVAWAVLQSGNRPFLVDVDPSTGNISAETLGRVTLDRVGALIACHMYGLGAPMREISQWAQSRSALLIEDAALALGAQADGQPAGSWGDVAVFSFGAGKIADLGIGGALLTGDDSLAREISLALRALPEWTPHLSQLEHQWLDIYWALHQHEQANPRLCALYPSLFETFGPITGYRLRPFPAEDLADALQTLPGNLEHRAEVAGFYSETLASLPAARTLIAPPGSIFWRYPLLVDPPHRDGLLRTLWAEGFHEVTRWYPSLRHMLSQLTPAPCFDQTPGADELSSRIINLSVDSEVDGPAAAALVAVVRAYFEQNPVG